MLQSDGNRKVGDIGENVAVKFLEKKGFVVLRRNYWKPFGEIDIVCRKGLILHFVEVKSVSRATISAGLDSYRPEDNMHDAKIRRLGRAIQSYLIETQYDGEWVLDLIAIRLDHANKKAHVSCVTNIVIPG